MSAFAPASRRAFGPPAAIITGVCVSPSSRRTWSMVSEIESSRSCPEP